MFDNLFEVAARQIILLALGMFGAGILFGFAIVGLIKWMN